MTILFHQNTGSLFAGSIFRALAPGVSYYTYNNYGPVTTGISIYAGAIPSPDTVVANWTNYNSFSPNFLVHYQAVSWNHVSQGQLLTINVPSAVTPTNSGTATWAIIWAGQPTSGDLAGSVLPLASFMVVSVSDVIGSGVIRFANTALLSSTAVAPSDGSIGCNIL